MFLLCPRGDEVKVTQAKKDLDAFPFPMAVSRAIPRPEAANTWEVWELKVLLGFENAAEVEK